MNYVIINTLTKGSIHGDATFFLDFIEYLEFVLYVTDQ